MIYVGVISSKFIKKFVQKCQCYCTLLDQIIPLMIATSDVSLLTEQLWIGPIDIFFLLSPDVALSLPCRLSQFSFSILRQPTDQRLSNIRMQQKNQMGQSYSDIIVKSGIIKFEFKTT